MVKAEKLLLIYGIIGTLLGGIYLYAKLLEYLESIDRLLALAMVLFVTGIASLIASQLETDENED